MKPELTSLISRKLNVKSFSMLLAIMLCMIGSSMIFLGIKDYGSIDFSSPFITGQAKSGFVGVLLIFCSLLVSIATLRYRTLESSHRKVSSEQTIRIKNGDIEIEWKGNLIHWDDSGHVKNLLCEMMSNLEKKEPN